MEGARAYCKKNFGELAIITGESERKFLWKQARNSLLNFPKTTMKVKMTVWCVFLKTCSVVVVK